MCERERGRKLCEGKTIITAVVINSELGFISCSLESFVVITFLSIDFGVISPEMFLGVLIFFKANVIFWSASFKFKF